MKGMGWTCIIASYKRSPQFPIECMVILCEGDSLAEHLPFVLRVLFLVAWINDWWNSIRGIVLGKLRQWGCNTSKTDKTVLMAVIFLSRWFWSTLFAPAAFMINLSEPFFILVSLVDLLYLFFFTYWNFSLGVEKHAPWLRRKATIAGPIVRYSLTTLIFQEICPYKVLWHALFQDVALHRHLKAILLNHHILGFICKDSLRLFFFTVTTTNAFISYFVFCTIVRFAFFSGNVLEFIMSRSEHFRVFTLFLYVTFFKLLLRVDALSAKLVLAWGGRGCVTKLMEALSSPPNLFIEQWQVLLSRAYFTMLVY